ncbi:Protein madd-4 [Dirofilaria immitis]
MLVIPTIVSLTFVGIVCNVSLMQVFAKNFKQNYGFNDDPNLEKIVHQGWAKWSEWGPCSSLCGDGISSQLRRCLDVRCVGPNHRERICNIQQCNNVSIQTKETRCSKLNILSNSDNNDNDNNHELLSEKWIPVKSSHQCMVVCRSIETGEEEELEKVIDGTKCFIEGYNKSVCVNGICQHVGCDGIVQSNARYDHCGVCGGTGESCGRTIFQWKDTKQFSPCDATCGPNTYRVSVSVCENVRNKRIVPERLCADQPRPRPVVEKCPHIVCPSQPSITVSYQWITGKWSECTASCNGGHQTRTVYCVESSNDTNSVVMENRKVDDQYCWQTHRPATSRKCNRKSCPKWEKGDWTSCSVTCGKGYRTRQVECRQEGERIDDYLCKSIDRPDDEQPCYTGVKCQTKFYNSMTDSSSALFDRFQ